MYCYDCLVTMGDRAKVPVVKLPIDLVIIHWPSESRSKSTAVHACLLAPEQTQMHDHPNIPDFNAEETVLLYPSEGAPTVADFPNMDKIKKVIFVDSQWHTAKRICNNEYVKGIPHIQITQYNTLFWRYQNCGPNCLATIEAIYYFFKEYQMRMSGTYEGQYDNLLFYFAYHYQLIQNNYKEKSRLFPRINNYVDVNFESPEQEAAEREYYEKNKFKGIQNRNKPPYKTHNLGKKKKLAAIEAAGEGDGEEQKNNASGKNKKMKANNRQFAKRIPKYVKKTDGEVLNNADEVDTATGDNEENLLNDTVDPIDDTQTKKRKVEI